MCLPSFPGHPINGMGSGNEASVTLLPTYSIALADMIHTQNKKAVTTYVAKVTGPTHLFLPYLCRC